jgi:protein SCO1/2
MRRSVVVAAALAGSLAASLISGCGDDEAPATLHGQRLDPPFAVSGTQLVDSEGSPYSLTSDTDKPLTLVFFGYTHCPDICQVVMANLASAMRRLDEADRENVDVVFVTTDPERDTGPVLRDYLDRFDPSFTGVTGDIDKIIEVGKSVAVGVGEKLPSGGYEVDAHSTQVTGIDAEDQAPVYWSQETSSAEFADDVHMLLGDR